VNEWARIGLGEVVRLGNAVGETEDEGVLLGVLDMLDEEDDEAWGVLVAELLREIEAVTEGAAVELGEEDSDGAAVDDAVRVKLIDEETEGIGVAVALGVVDDAAVLLGNIE